MNFVLLIDLKLLIIVNSLFLNIPEHENFSANECDNTNYCYRHSGSVVERPLCDREVAGSIPGRVIPKTLKMVLAALSLGAQH